jgi:glucans biosynthesis protein
MDFTPCGARTRAGTPCKRRPTGWSKRCHLHGGAPGSGAPKGNKNALKHGRFTREAIQRRKEEREFLKPSWKVIED